MERVDVAIAPADAAFTALAPSENPGPVRPRNGGGRAAAEERLASEFLKLRENDDVIGGGRSSGGGRGALRSPTSLNRGLAGIDYVDMIGMSSPTPTHRARQLTVPFQAVREDETRRPSAERTRGDEGASHARRSHRKRTDDPQHT